MRKYTIAIIAVACGLGQVNAQDAQQPQALKEAVREYVKELLKPMTYVDWDLNFSARFSGTLKQPEGGYLFRFFIDIDGDGKQELFLSSTYESEALLRCCVYTPGENGKYIRVGKDIVVQDNFYHWGSEPGKREFQTLDHGGRDRLCNLYRYSVGAGAKIDVLPVISLEDAQMGEKFGSDITKFSAYYHVGQKVPFSAEKVSMAEFFGDNNVKWRPYTQDIGPENQNHGAEEQEVIRKSEIFHITDAMKALGMEIPKYLRPLEPEAATQAAPATDAAPQS